ncbi:MAG: glycosyltransferase, partial [Alphaproteobacteria bacterium]
MRVLQAMAGARHGGAETAFSDTVLALARHGLSQQTLIRPWPERQAQMAAGGIATGTAPFGGLVDITTRRRFRRAVSDFRPTIVQTWMQRATRFCPPAERAGFVHLGWLGGYYGLRAYRHCHHLAGVTEAIRNHLTAAGWPPERAHVLRTFAVRESDPPVDRASLDTPADAPLIVALARLHQKKGLDVLLHAMVDLPQAFLWLAGEGPLRSELETLCQRLGLRNRVRFLGWRTDRGALLKAADVCAFPSRYEPLGTVTVEAWAHDTPI